MRIMCFDYKYFFLQSPCPPTGESQKEKIHSILTKTKVLYQGSWRQVFVIKAHNPHWSLTNYFQTQLFDLGDSNFWSVGHQHNLKPL